MVQGKKSKKFSGTKAALRERIDSLRYAPPWRGSSESEKSPRDKFLGEVRKDGYLWSVEDIVCYAAVRYGVEREVAEGTEDFTARHDGDPGSLAKSLYRSARARIQKVPGARQDETGRKPWRAPRAGAMQVVGELGRLLLRHHIITPAALYLQVKSERTADAQASFDPDLEEQELRNPYSMSFEWASKATLLCLFQAVFASLNDGKVMDVAALWRDIKQFGELDSMVGRDVADCHEAEERMRLFYRLLDYKHYLVCPAPEPDGASESDYDVDARRIFALSSGFYASPWGYEPAGQGVVPIRDSGDASRD